MRIFSLFFIAYVSLFAFDVTKVTYSSHQVANGKTLLLQFKKQDGITYNSVTLGKQKYVITTNPLDTSEAYAFVPFSYYATKENKRLNLEYKEAGRVKKEELLVKVVDGKYAKEQIEVAKEKVNPQKKEVKERIAKEYKEAMDIYSYVSKNSYVSKPFILPLNSAITSDFGKARVYNGSLKGYHSGTDFRAKTGTPIVAVNDGKVVLVADRFYSGGSVVIDHGYGVYSCYFHLSDFGVKEGDIVKRGERIGLSGASGRVTGPHLHFAVRVGGVQVDPLQLIELFNSKLLKGEKS